jgi:DNA/RNA endonuclease YhcR with UshA esterase domain
MLDHRKILILAVAVSLIGVMSLFLYSTTIKPTELAVGEIDEGMVGKIVRTSGTIKYSKTLSDGSLSLLLTDVATESSVRVYVPVSIYDSWTGVILTPGLVIEAVGEVEIYGEEVEISVSSAEGLEVMSTSVNPVFELWQILESADVLEHMNLTTGGTAYDIDVIESSGELIGTTFVVTERSQNSTYSLDCIIFDTDISALIEEGDSVTVTGVLEFYKYRGCWQLDVSDIAVENKTY